jgi:hypothetical protein
VGFDYPVIRKLCHSTWLLSGMLLLTFTVNFYLLQQTVAGVFRSLAPAISNTLFSLSIDKGYLGGYMVYFVFVGSAAMALCASSLLPRGGIAPHQKENGLIEI